VPAEDDIVGGDDDGLGQFDDARVVPVVPVVRVVRVVRVDRPVDLIVLERGLYPPERQFQNRDICPDSGRGFPST
jgi:hypothetical protein